MAVFKKPKYVNKPFSRLPLKQRAVFILHKAGFTYKEIARFGKVSSKTISKVIQRGYEEYTN